MRGGMRQNQWPAASPHAGSRGPVHGPSPARRAGEALDDLIRSLEADCKLGLTVRDPTWSPSTRTDSLPDKVQGQIKRLFYSDKSALMQTLSDFETKARKLPTQKERLDFLHLSLRTVTPSPQTARVTRSQTLRDGSHKSLRDPPSSQVSSSARTFQILRDDTSSAYATAQDSGSSTDEEEDWRGPPSPSASIKAVSKQGQASPHISLGLKGKKRPSQSSGDDGGSPRLTKITKGKHKSEKAALSATVNTRKAEAPSLFKKPSLDMARSYQATSAQTSFNTSFNSNSNSNTMWSSQQTNAQPDTAVTSFNSDFADPGYPKLTRSSSTTIGSLETEDLLEVSHKLGPEPSRVSLVTTRSSTTYGSIDEDAMLQVSSKYTIPEQTPGSALSRSTAVSPPKLPPRPPVTLSSQDSPSGMSHLIRSIPQHNIFVDDISGRLKRFPYFILFICLRISIEQDIPLQNLTYGMDEDLVAADSEAFWAKVESISKAASHTNRESKKVWAAAQKDLEGYTFKGRVAFNPQSSKPVFRLESLQIEKDNSCRFQRAFGTDRFLYLSFPGFQTGPRPHRFTKIAMSQIEEKWLEWCRMEHSFLGRTWRVFHVEPSKRGKGKRSSDDYGIRVVLFAIEGIGIRRPCAVGDMLDWFFPFAKNQHQSFCKAYARLDLGLSKTVPTLVFKPSQIRYVEDIAADGTPEDTRFDDKSLHWPHIDDKPVMNDGCSVMSLGAAREIWRIYKTKTGITERFPTAFQARIGGAKGLWVVSSEVHNGPPPIWIEISKSQLKFDPHSDDYFDETFDPLRLTFELVNYSSSPSPSDLHLSFIPIMVDRGVPRAAIEKIMADRLRLERAELLETLVDPARTYDWVHKLGSTSAEDLEDLLWQAALPLALREKVKLLLESGFHPTEEPFLGASLTRLVKQEHLYEEQKLRIPLGKSAFLYGVADPLGILAPGEIHVQFSTWFVDDVTEDSYLCLDDVEVLVARQPACRRSDLQKVRAITHPKLGHLVDVVVFPTRGQYPLAGKLQGGDYDGDIFWLCWEPELVGPFRNAPAPTQELEPSRYGIRQNKEKLRDVMSPHNLSTVDNFLKHAFQFRIGASLLGIVTNYLEKQAYAENRIYSRLLDSLCDMHDLLVDAPKQGYTFTERDFENAKKKLGIRLDPELPVYKKAMTACMKAKELGEAEKVRTQVWKYNKDNVIDHLYFRVVRKHHIETQKEVEKLFEEGRNDDPMLQYPYFHEKNKGSIVVELELKRLFKSFDSIYSDYFMGLRKNGGQISSDDYNLVVKKGYDRYRALMPEQVDIPEIKAWLEPYLSPGFTRWECIRASALYTKYPWKEKATFVYHMAGKELADMKSPPSRTVRRVVAPVYSILKPISKKLPKKLEEADSDDDDEFGTPLEEEP